MTNAAREPRHDEPMTLAHAAEYYGFSEWTLRTEADRGNLTIYKIGRAHYTTPDDIKEMVRLCRVDKKGHGFTSIQSDGNGLSETDRASSALAAANESVLKLRRSSASISVASTSRSRRARQ